MSRSSKSWNTCVRPTRIRGALAEFRVDDTECTVSFKGPGYSADAFIDRESGQYTLTEFDHGLIAVINDLHKGRDTGAGLVGGHRPLGRFDDDHLADRPGLALLSQAQARSRPGCGPCRHGHSHCHFPALGTVRNGTEVTSRAGEAMVGDRENARSQVPARERWLFLDRCSLPAARIRACAIRTIQQTNGGKPVTESVTERE